MNPEVFRAAKNGDNKIIQDLYSSDRKILRGATFEGNTVLHIAAREGHLELVQWILENVKGSSMPVARNADRNTPLHEAAKRGNDGIISALLRYNKCAAAKRNQFGESALLIASEHGHVEAVKVLMQTTPVYVVLCPRNDRQTCLHVAAYGGHLDIVDLILQTHSFCNVLQFIMIIHDVHGATPLHSAVHGGNVKIVSEIAKKQLHCWFCMNWFDKSLMTKKDKFGRCAVHLAAIKGNEDIMDEFLLIMPDCVEIRSTDFKTALHFAVEHNQFEIVKKLLPQNKREEMAELVKYDRDISGNTLLHLATINGVDPELVDYLLAFVNVNSINNEGLSALDKAATASFSALDKAAPASFSALDKAAPASFSALDKAATASFSESKFTKITGFLTDHGASRSFIGTSRPSNSTDSKQESSGVQKLMDVDTLVASLIATVTFAAIFTVPGGIDDKDNESAPAPSAAVPAPAPTGVARMALETLFQVFLFSDSLAMFASLTVVIAWLFRERLQTKLTADRSLLAKLSVFSLGISIVCTGLAFLSATILVTIPRYSKSINHHENRPLLWGEISTAFSAPALSLIFLSILWAIEYNFRATLEIRARLGMQLKEALIYIIPPFAISLGLIIGLGYYNYFE